MRLADARQQFFPLVLWEFVHIVGNCIYNPFFMGSIPVLRGDADIEFTVNKLALRQEEKTRS